MKVIPAEHMGLCFGVRDALAKARGIGDPTQITVLGQLVHNPAVTAELAARGFNQSESADTPTVLITAHGVSNRRRAALAAAGKKVIDATCPLVRRAHEAAMKFAREGRFVIVLGTPGHVETRGLVGDLTAFAVVEKAADVARFPAMAIGIVCQTTTPGRVAEELVEAIRRANPQADVAFLDTICQPTRDRQTALEELLGKVDVLVVVGGRESRNTGYLAERARERGVRVVRVEGAEELGEGQFAAGERVGLTAGTSTLPETVRRVHVKLMGFHQRRAIPQSSREWREYFEANGGAREFPEEKYALTAAERRAITRSVQEFQLGESGEGQHIMRQAKRQQGEDGEYVRALRLFIAEEIRHSKELGAFMARQGIACVRHTWVDTLFRRVRHLAGLELSIAVLVTAEIIAKVYYAALRDATESVRLRALCQQILADEVFHIHFQCQRLAILRGRCGRMGLAWRRAAYGMFFRATLLLIWPKHRRVFRKAGVSFGGFYGACVAELREARVVMQPTQGGARRVVAEGR